MNKLWGYKDYAKHLYHSNKLLRRWAFQAFEERFQNRYTDEVSHLIGDEDSHLACAAPRYLAKHGAVQHAEKIITCFQESNGNIASNCALALGMMRYESVADQMLEHFSSADNAETFFGILEYLGKVKREDCHEALRSAVLQLQDSFLLQSAIHNLLLHYHVEDISLVLEKYFEVGLEDHYSDSFLKTIASTLGGDGYFGDLTENSQHSIIEKPEEVIDLFISRNPTVDISKGTRKSIVESLSNKAFKDLVTMMMFDAKTIIHKRYPDEITPDWLADTYNQDAVCLALLEELSKRSSTWKQVKNTNYAERNLVALVLAVFFAVVEREAYVKALSPDATLDELIHALINTGSDFPDAIQEKIKERQPVAQLTGALTEELMTWGDIWTVRVMKQIGSAEFVHQLIRVINQSDSLDYIYDDALKTMYALDESSDELIITSIKNRELGDWQSFSILEHLPYSEAYDLAIELWHDENNEMDSYEIFACCLEGIGDPRGVKTLRNIYNHENNATYIGESLECLAALHDIDLPELPEIQRQREESEERRKAREEELNELASNYNRQKAKGTLSSPGQVIPFKREEPKIGRNEPCPCGSGKKYKKCCLRKK